MTRDSTYSAVPYKCNQKLNVADRAHKCSLRATPALVHIHFFLTHHVWRNLLFVMTSLYKALFKIALFKIVYDENIAYGRKQGAYEKCILM